MRHWSSSGRHWSALLMGLSSMRHWSVLLMGPSSVSVSFGALMAVLP
jgi:hypothetical protein